MATVRVQKDSLSATFGTKDGARRWAISCETAMKNGTYVRTAWERGRMGVMPVETPRDADDTDQEPAGSDTVDAVDPNTPSVRWTLKHALQKWAAQVVVYSDEEKAWRKKYDRIKVWMQHPILADKPLCDITPKDLQAHVDARLAGKMSFRVIKDPKKLEKLAKTRTKGVKPNTIRNDMFVLSAMFQYAATKVDAHDKGWELPIENPVDRVVLPGQPKARSRRLMQARDDTELGERERLRKALSELPEHLHPKIMTCVYDLAIETGMRQSELLDLRLHQVRKYGNVVMIIREDSKNDETRNVTMSPRAGRALGDLVAMLPRGYRSDPDTKLIDLPWYKLATRWKKARTIAKVTGLTWHDLRHEGISIMAEKGLTIGELQAQSGHKTVDILVDYINAVPATIAAKLARDQEFEQPEPKAKPKPRKPRPKATDKFA